MKDKTKKSEIEDRVKLRPEPVEREQFPELSRKILSASTQRRLGNRDVIYFGIILKALTPCHSYPFGAVSEYHINQRGSAGTSMSMET